jgi:wobble nucleotide-excising tRNase
VSEIDRLRNHAEHVRWLARWITDQRAEKAFEDLANDLDRRAAEIERKDAQRSFASSLYQVVHNLKYWADELDAIDPPKSYVSADKVDEGTDYGVAQGRLVARRLWGAEPAPLIYVNAARMRGR